MSSRRLRDTFPTLRLTAAAALATAALALAHAPPATAQQALTIQDGISVAGEPNARKQRLGTPALGSSGGGQRRQPLGFVDSLLQGPRLTTTPPEAADWVRKSRPTEAPRKEIARPAGPSRPALTPEQVRRREAALDAARVRHDRIAGRRSAGPTATAAAPRPDQKAAKGKTGCVMTCSDPIGVPRRR